MILQKTPDIPIQTNFLSLPPSTSVKTAIKMMAEAQASCAIVIEEQKLLGIFTERDVVRITTNSTFVDTLALSELMTKDVVTLKISEASDIFSLSRLFSKNRIRHLPVIDEQNQVVGVVTPHSVRNILKPEYLLRYVRVMEVMSKQVIHGLPSDSILIIAQQMAIHRVSCIVIVDPQTLYPIGILTERDVVKFHHMNLDFTQVSAQEVMSTPLSTMCPEDSLWSVHQRMQALNVRRLVIQQSTGELAGIVTQTQMLKILDPTEMYHVMVQMQEIIEQQTKELHQLNQRLKIVNGELEKLSTIDELTQIDNRRRFNEFLAHEWQRLSYLVKPLSLILCDVDYFKRYNDTYGHVAGDECLIKIAKAIRAATRQTSDLVARYGGEEFAVVLPNTDSDGAERVSKNILTQVQSLQIPHASSEIMSFVTMSMGTVTVIPNSSNSPEMSLQIADELLYQSKQQGRNTYNFRLIS
ncbi:diguanylate cyclase domain-containing protein [Pseudanabaena sp. Chao 1811]|uniref:diguanylate cyclase domain-containing protein n=1 Tax=Pseudanabaena sp. Chao 1811 TaxID=2963092 RepID=UPI0022F3BF23|nr:diguanylate cyclase [Pseudanabaena sp. Chao 1811]